MLHTHKHLDITLTFLGSEKHTIVGTMVSEDEWINSISMNNSSITSVRMPIALSASYAFHTNFCQTLDFTI